MTSEDPGLHAAALGMSQIMLKNRQAQKAAEGGGFLGTKDIISVVDELVSMPSFAGVARERLAAELQERFTVVTGRHQTLGEEHDHIPWLPMKRASLQWRFWDRYQLYMAEKVPASAVESIDAVTDEVLQRIEDPLRSGTWDTRGLVMGHVQSGKTANYIGLMCKAADAGYKVMIILSGIHNSLRSQTQVRVDEGFLGFMSDAPGTQAFTVVGVGEIDRSLRADTGTNRTQNGDFNETVARQFGIHPGGNTLVFVVKKHVGVLDNLIRWIASCADAHDEASGRRYVRNVPALIIDDEADIASVDTRGQVFDEDGNPDEDHDPAATNRNIRLLLRSFEKVAYVAYTATPFANIYIHDNGRTKALGPDLFPRNFIVNIPAPSNYMGPARIFGLDPDPDTSIEAISPLPITRRVSDHADSDRVDETNGWMPPKLVAKTGHSPLYMGEPTVPPSLRQAMLAFLLATAVRRVREPGPKLNTMLVHVVRYTLVQRKVWDQVTAVLKDIQQRLRLGDGGRKPTLLQELEQLWRTDFEPTTKTCMEILGESPLREVAWEEVRPHLEAIAAGIKIKLINGSAGDVLEYEEHRKTGLDVIAIGGDKLSRGLTLDGLSVSYFLRASRMYDTLMQMGRWFGYRERYIDVCRLYTTDELAEWFSHIAAASVELQREFEHMASVGGTPASYGLKVRSHPVMSVTSAVKCRNGTEMRLSYRASVSETIKFSTAAAWLRSNRTATETWLRSLRPAASDPHPRWTASAEDMLRFLGSYKTLDDAVLLANTSLLSRYIRTRKDAGELTEWSVFLITNTMAVTKHPFAGHSIGWSVRKPNPARTPETPPTAPYTFGRLVDPAHESLDLDDGQRDAALQATIRTWESSTRRKKAEKQPTRPNGLEARMVRSPQKGLLLLYALDPKEAGLPKEIQEAGPIIGFGLSFPDSPNRDTDVGYTVNNVFTSRGGDDDSF